MEIISVIYKFNFKYWCKWKNPYKVGAWRYKGLHYCDCLKEVWKMRCIVCRVCEVWYCHQSFERLYSTIRRSRSDVPRRLAWHSPGLTQTESTWLRKITLRHAVSACSVPHLKTAIKQNRNCELLVKFGKFLMFLPPFFSLLLPRADLCNECLLQFQSKKKS